MRLLAEVCALCSLVFRNENRMFLTWIKTLNHTCCQLAVCFQHINQLHSHSISRLLNLVYTQCVKLMCNWCKHAITIHRHMVSVETWESPVTGHYINNAHDIQVKYNHKVTAWLLLCIVSGYRPSRQTASPVHSIVLIIKQQHVRIRQIIA